MKRSPSSYAFQSVVLTFLMVVLVSGDTIMGAYDKPQPPSLALSIDLVLLLIGMAFAMTLVNWADRVLEIQRERKP